jgi:DNA-binding CsgD family transcriptional regulator
VKTEFGDRSQADQGAHPAIFRNDNSGNIPHTASIIHRRIRRKRHIAWEQAEFASGGLYAHNFEEIAKRYPSLTITECRVCALVKAMLPSWRIGELLGICEDTVENHRVNARRKMCLQGERLAHHLAHLS